MTLLTEYKIKFPKPVHFISLQITLTPLRSNPNSFSLAISPLSPPTSDLDTSILKELSQHKTPKSFLDFLVSPHRLYNVNSRPS